MKKSFTLSEILIAIAIIGIIAAIVVPVFIDITNGYGYKTKFKKTITTLTRAATANYGENTYDFRDVRGYYGDENGYPIECYSLAGGASDGALIGSDTVGFTGANIRADLHNKSMSIYNIFHSFLNMTPSGLVYNYSVGPASLDLKCASREPAGGTVRIKAGSREMDVNIVSSFEERLNDLYGGFYPLCGGRMLGNGGFNQGRMFMMDDGSVFTYDPSQVYCTESNPCFGYIDVNGPLPPNQMISCSVGEDSFILTYGGNANKGVLQGTCEVKPQDITDIYPVVFYDQIVKPASWAAKAVFFDRMKSNQIGELTLPNE